MNPIGNSVFGIFLIFFCTTLGSAFVFLFRKKKVSSKINQICVGFAAGIMLSASMFSLIMPAIQDKETYMPTYILAAIGIFAGAVFLFGIDKLVPHFHFLQKEEEGIPNEKLNKITKMFLAVTIHNIPEGLSVGIAYGVGLAAVSADSATAAAAMTGALMLAIGIGLQNIPEGTSVSLPIASETGKPGKAFVFGMLSGAVEPVAAIVGLFLAYYVQALMPWALSFAAGCMIYVIVEEMVPDAQADPTNHFGVWSFIAGFLLMMVLDNLVI
jgi:ZIP family zinc transporter